MIWNQLQRKNEKINITIKQKKKNNSIHKQTIFQTFCKNILLICKNFKLNFFLKNRSAFKYGGSGNINDVIRTVLNSFFTKRYCTHKNTHKQISANKTKKLTLNNKGNNFSRVKTSKRMKVTYFTLAYNNL